MSNSEQTISDARDVMALELLGGRNTDGGWPYRAGQASCTEATSLAVLALGAQAAPPDLTGARDWLAARQRGDGFLTAGLAHEEPGWVTPLAGMALTRLEHLDAANRAAEALLNAPVKTFGGFLAAGLYGYDTTLAGWSWTVGDFGFVEPTALAVIFLKQRGYGAAERVRTAVHMLRDRAIRSGGWNYGEPEVLGGGLYPTVAPTALALLALADEPDDVTARAVEWMEPQLGQTGTLFTLGWACIALNLIERAGEERRLQLANLWGISSAARRGPMDTALALLALTERQSHPLRVI